MSPSVPLRKLDLWEVLGVDHSPPYIYIRRRSRVTGRGCLRLALADLEDQKNPIRPNIEQQPAARKHGMQFVGIHVHFGNQTCQDEGCYILK